MNKWLSALAVNLERRPVAVAFLGFSSGLPFLLVFGTLTTWLAREGVQKSMIGMFALVGSAYALKFWWSPLVDRLPLPPFTTLLGRRRGWIVFSQLVLIVAMLALGSTTPKTELWWTALWAVVLAFASATQDIALDAFRIEILEERQLGAGASNVVLGYRVGLLAAGAGALTIAELYSWFWAYAAMAGLMVVGIATVLVLLEPEPRTSATAQAREAQIAQFIARFANLPPRLQPVAAWLQAAVVNPFADFMARPGWVVILLFVALYKYADALLGVMANPFYVEMGFTNIEIAEISKGWGLAMTLIGGVLGGTLVARVGILKAMLICGVLQGGSNLMYVVQAMVGHSVPMLSLTIAIENLTGGMGTAAFVAYLSSLCNIAYTATQYALLSSLTQFARPFLSAWAGVMVEQLGWIEFFLVSTVAAVPGLVLLILLIRRFPIAEPAQGQPALAGVDD